MNSLKIGIIGLFIIIPFWWVSHLTIRQEIDRQKVHTAIEKNVENALRDGVFAMKTFSQFNYQPDNLVEIILPEEEIVEIMVRSYRYGLNRPNGQWLAENQPEIKLIGMIQYDRVIFYQPDNGQRLAFPFVFEEVEKKNQTINWKWRGTGFEGQNNDILRNQVQEAMMDVLGCRLPQESFNLAWRNSTLYGSDYNQVSLFMVIKGDPFSPGQEKYLLKMSTAQLSEKRKP